MLGAAALGLAVAEFSAALAASAFGLSNWFVLRAGTIFLAAMLVAGGRVANFHPHRRFGAANTVTTLRLALVALVAAAVGEGPTAALAWTVTATTILVSVLDGVDGLLARRSALASVFGARFDMETDALLILALSLLAWRWGHAGAWVLACGLMRYGFVASAWVWRWLERPLPPSLRRKVVCVIQIVGLAIVVAPAVAPPLSAWLAAATLAALTWSFAIDVGWLARERDARSVR